MRRRAGPFRKKKKICGIIRAGAPATPEANLQYFDVNLKMISNLWKSGRYATELNSARIRKRIRVELAEAGGKSFDDQISIVNHTIDYTYLYSRCWSSASNW